MKSELTPEQIEKNWGIYNKFFDQVGDRSESVQKMLEAIGDALCVAPASSRKHYHNAFPGGLVDHSLRVLKNAIKLKKTFEWTLPNDSVIIGCLFHDLGKSCHVNDDGTLIDYYVVNESEWHKDKLGEVYTINEKIPYMTVPQRGLWLCQRFGIKLSTDETLAILLNDGMYIDENKPYKGKEPLLATLVHVSDYLSTKQEKGIA